MTTCSKERLPQKTLAGHHAGKLRQARWAGVRAVAATTPARRRYDMVVEHTGSPQGLW